ALGLIVLSGFGPGAAASEMKQRKNILLIIADDIGTEKIGCYGVGAETPPTPTLDALCADSVKYTSAWAQPACSPTRTSIMTGRFGFRTGSLTPTGPIPVHYDVEGAPKFLVDGQVLSQLVKVGDFTAKEGSPLYYQTRGEKIPFKPAFGTGPRPDETLLPELLRDHAGYKTAAIGKWHMADGQNSGEAGLHSHPNAVGFDYFIGSMAGGIENYYRYQKYAQGEDAGISETYATTDTVNDAINWLDRIDDDAPWFMWLAFNAPHDPFQKPPMELISKKSRALDPDGITAQNANLYYDAMIEALDTEIGRLLRNIDRDNTIVIFVGDNGTPQSVLGAPYPSKAHGKGTLYQGGVHVPLMISGAGRSSKRDSRLAHTVDLFATVLEFAGVDIQSQLLDKPIDSKSLVSSARREWIFADQKGVLPTAFVDEQALRNRRYKLVVDRRNETMHFFDLEDDPFEASPLDLANLSKKEQKNLSSLKAELESLLQP
ncbi:MAG: sulfatase-like hydrolase/transferase, partial [Pseudomonadota bacterium]